MQLFFEKNALNIFYICFGFFSLTFVHFSPKLHFLYISIPEFRRDELENNRG
jgi:hypothetical protein